MIAIDFQPLSIVENERFKILVAELNPRYKMISRKTVTSKILTQCCEMAAVTLKKNCRTAKMVMP